MPGRDSVIAMSRYVTPACRAASRIGGLKRGSHAFRIASARSLFASATICSTLVASTCAAAKRSPSPATARSARSLVDVGEHHPLEERALRRNGSGGAADTAGAEDDDPHRYLVCGKPRSTFEVAGSGHRDVTTFERV